MSSKQSRFFFFFNDTATTEIYTRPYTLSLHDALPICFRAAAGSRARAAPEPARAACSRAPCRRRSEEHTSELQSHGLISYAVFCLKQKKLIHKTHDQGSLEHIKSSP